MLQLIVAKDSGRVFNRYLQSLWKTEGHQPCPKALYKRVTDHFLSVLAGKVVFTYSSAVNTSTADLRAKYHVPKDSKIVLVAMSSYDERFAVETIGELERFDGLLFRDQEEWLQFLIKKYQNLPGVFFLFRVHPREFPNRRESFTSEHARKMAEMFDKLPSNMAVNWPVDGFSIYDLSKEVNLVLTSWSGVGREMTLLGIPVVAYDRRLLGYPENLHAIGENLESYSAAITDQLNRQCLSLEDVIRTFRWMIFEIEYGVLNLRQWHSLAWQKSRWFGRLAYVMRRLNLIWIERYDMKQDKEEFEQVSKQIMTYLESNEDVMRGPPGLVEGYPTAEEERRLVKNELKRILEVLFPHFSPNTDVNKKRLELNLRRLIDEA
jgi:hypothetical protein